MFIPSTFKRPVSSWKALNLRKTLLMASSVRLKPLNCSRLPCVYAQETLTFLLDRKSGSAGMPRPNSYAVFCLKKKKLTGFEFEIFYLLYVNRNSVSALTISLLDLYLVG